MAFRIGVDGDVALVQMTNHGIRQWPRCCRVRDRVILDMLLGDQHGHRCALGVVVLTSNVEDIGADDVGHVGQNRGQPFGVVGLVDVGDVRGALLGRVGVADIVDVEAQRFGEVVEAMQLQALRRCGHDTVPERAAALCVPSGRCGEPASALVARGFQLENEVSAAERTRTAGRVPLVRARNLLGPTLFFKCQAVNGHADDHSAA